MKKTLILVTDITPATLYLKITLHVYVKKNHQNEQTELILTFQSLF